MQPVAAALGQRSGPQETSNTIEGVRYDPGMPDSHALLRLLRDVTQQLDRDVSLESLARRAGWSRFHLHRELGALLGETPKRYTQRLRLATAAALLATTERSIGDVASAAGFASHAVFTRAFRRSLGRTPQQYRATALRDAPRHLRLGHRELVSSTVPCLRLYRMTTIRRGTTTMPILSIERRQLPEVPVLLIRRRIPRDQLAATIGECFGLLWDFAQKAGLAETGRPTVRYQAVGPGLWTIEACKPLAAKAAGRGDIEAGSLQAGPTAVALHAGQYDELQQTYAALEQWMDENGWRANGAPWEVYLNDPSIAPDPKDWRTEVCWPIAKK
jgi:AraC family transcriptional regulator